MKIAQMPCSGFASWFPLTNPITGTTLWFALTLSNSGASVSIHQHCPVVDTSLPLSWETAMAAVHVDFFGGFPETPEQITVQLWDETTDPTGDPGWQGPAGHGSAPDTSIVLVKNVAAWQPPQAVGDGYTREG